MALRIGKITVYIAIDSLLSPRGKILFGFENFQQALDEAGIPTVYVTGQSRIQVDDSRRRLGHSSPFIAEGGSGVLLPEDYFHLKPTQKTIRLGRFTCIPIAKPLPAAKDALDSLSEAVEVPVVPLRSLSPRELSQNTGLPQKEAEVVRQRDFTELFFFAGASDSDIARFQGEAAARGLQLVQDGVIWSLAVGANLSRCVRELSGLYDRALKSHSFRIAIGTGPNGNKLFSECDRAIQLLPGGQALSEVASNSGKIAQVSLNSPDSWERVLELVQS